MISLPVFFGSSMPTSLKTAVDAAKTVASAAEDSPADDSSKVASRTEGQPSLRSCTYVTVLSLGLYCRLHFQSSLAVGPSGRRRATHGVLQGHG